jgi:ribosomal protein S18 acetylase RimI-like enzyme
VGKQLYACMETLAKKEKLKRIDLKVWSFNREAYAFYKSLGLEIQCCIMEKRFKD